MPLPPLTAWERNFYRDKCSFFIIVAGPTGNTIGYTPVFLADGTPLQNIWCDKHSTPNFDTTHAGVAMSKEDNIMTANHITCQYVVGVAAILPTLGTGLAVRSGRVVQVTSRFGDIEWWEVQGDPENPYSPGPVTQLACTHVYGVPRPEPVIIPPAASPA